MANWWLAMLITYLDPLHPGLLHTPPLRTATRSFRLSLQREVVGELVGSGNDVIAETSAPKVSHWFPSRRRVFGPPAEEGVRVWHQKTTRKETSSAPECVSQTISTAVCVRVDKNRTTSLPRRTRCISLIVRKGQSSYVNVKMSLSTHSYPRRSWRPCSSCGEGEWNGGELSPVAVASVHRTGKTAEQTAQEEPSPS